MAYSWLLLNMLCQCELDVCSRLRVRTDGRHIRLIYSHGTSSNRNRQNKTYVQKLLLTAAMMRALISAHFSCDLFHVMWIVIMSICSFEVEYMNCSMFRIRIVFFCAHIIEHLNWIVGVRTAYVLSPAQRSYPHVKKEKKRLHIVL